MTRNDDARVRAGSLRNSSAAAPPLPPPPGSSYPPPHPRAGRRWLIAAAVVLLLVAGTVTALLIGRDSSRTTTSTPPSSQPASSAVPTASATTSETSATASVSASQQPTQPELLPRGQEAPASAIRWNQVDAGWSLRAWTASSNPGALTPATLYLVNPIGGRYRITTLVPNTAVVGWSSDRRRAIVEVFGSTSRRVQEIELGTGRQLSSFVLGNRGLFGYAGPGGHSLLLSYPEPYPAGQGGPSGLERVSTSGAHQLSYPGSAPLTGRLVGNTALYSPDGSRFLIAGQRGFALFSNDGALLRQISYPPASCMAERWWSDRLVLGTCSSRPPAGSSLYGPPNLVLVSVDTGRITQVTKSVAPDYGFLTGWRFTDGIIAQRATSCGPGGLATIDSTGAAHSYRYHLPAGVSGQARLTGVFADKALLVTGNCGASAGSLVSLDLRSGIATALLGPGMNGGTIH